MSTECRNKITWLSFVLSLFVMMIHVTNFRAYGINKGLLFQIESFIESVALFAVPTFFAISGYLFFRNYSPEQAALKIKRRIKSVLIPFFIWGGVYCIILSCLQYIPYLGSFVNQTDSFMEEVFAIFVCGEGSHFWYLRNLVIYIVVAPLMFYLIKHIWCVPIYIACATGFHLIFREGIYSITMYSIFFFIGGWFAVHFCEYVEKTFGAKARVSAFIVLCALWVLNWKLSGIIMLRFFWFLLGIPMIWISSCVLRTFGQPLVLVKNSFFIYVSHVIILETIEKLFWVFLPHSVAGAALDYCLAPIITLGIIYICIKLLSKNGRLQGVLTGNRG